MDKIILLMIVGLLIIGAIALNDILNPPDTENTPTTTEDKPITIQVLIIQCQPIIQKLLKTPKLHLAMLHNVKG